MNFKTDEASLRELFEAHGEVDEVAIINDRATGRPRGIAFVIMPDDEQARQAIASLNEQELDGRVLTVNEAKPRGEGSDGPGSSHASNLPRTQGYANRHMRIN